MSGTELRELLDRAVAPVDDMPDLVPRVLAAGRSSVRRRRAVTTGLGAVAGVVATVGVANVVWGPVVEWPSAGPAVSPSPSSVSSSETPPPGADDPAFRAFKGRMAAALEDALPARLGVVRSAASAPGYTAVSAEGTFPITFRLDPWGMPQPTRCPVEGQPSDSDAAVVSCLEQRLSNGQLASAFHELASGGTVLPRVETVIDGNWLQLYLFAYQGSPRKVPSITDRQLINVLADRKVAALVQEWSAHPEWQIG